MSVSARDTERRAAQARPAPKSSSPSYAFLTPRVLDQASFDDLAGTLRSLLDEAGVAIGTLEDRLRVFEERARKPMPESARLQERLRLGARMLQAFQTQIDRANATVDEMGERGDALATGAAVVLRETKVRLRDAVRSHAKEIDATDDRLRVVEDRVEALERTTEVAEVDAAALSGRVAATRKMLDMSVAEAGEATASIDDRLALCAEAERRLDAKLAALEGAEDPGPPLKFRTQAGGS